jgi:hypothetical protein
MFVSYMEYYFLFWYPHRDISLSRFIFVKIFYRYFTGCLRISYARDLLSLLFNICSTFTHYHLSFCCVLQVHSLFLSEFPTERNLVISLSINIILLLCSRSFSSILCLLLRLSVTSILPSIFPSATCLER